MLPARACENGMIPLGERWVETALPKPVKSLKKAIYSSTHKIDKVYILYMSVYNAESKTQFVKYHVGSMILKV